MFSLTRLAWRHNLSLVRSPSDAELWAAFGPDSRAAVQSIAGQQPELLVFITTYERPQAMFRLIAALRAALDAARASGTVRSWHVVVVDDASTAAAQDAVRERLATELGDSATQLTARENHGKRGFWRTHALLHRIAREVPTEHALFLQDDLTFEPTMIERALELWRHIDDDRKRVLYLLRLPGDESEGRWVRFSRVASVFPGIDRTQWFDLAAFLVGAEFFRTLRYRVFPVPATRWRRRLLLSSGVGEQYTLRLFTRGSVYQVREPLLRHGEQPSLMNVEERQRRPMCSE